MSSTTSKSGVVAAILLAAAGCNAPPSATATNAPAATAPAGLVITDAHRAEAKEIFSGRCTPCHGQTGAGDGAASASLSPRPRNLQDPAWQKEVSDEYIEKIIKYGGAAVGRAPMMPANPDLAAKDATVAALREYVRTLAK